MIRIIRFTIFSFGLLPLSSVALTASDKLPAVVDSMIAEMIGQKFGVDTEVQTEQQSVISRISPLSSVALTASDKLPAVVDNMIAAMIDQKFGVDAEVQTEQQSVISRIDASSRISGAISGSAAEKRIEVAKIDPMAKQPVSGSGCFAIESFSVAGSELLTDDLVLEKTRDLIGECATKELIGKALNQLNNTLLDRGYVTSRVYIGPQDLTDGTVEFIAVDGRIEAFEFGDNSVRDRLKVAAAFPIGEGDILNINDLEQGVDQMSQLRSVQVSMNLIPGSEAGSTIVKLEKAPPEALARSVRFKTGIDNSGSQATGTEKLTIGIDADNLLALNDTWTLTHIGSIDTNALAATLAIPTGYWSHSVNYSYSDYLNPIDSDTQMFGRSETIGAESKVKLYESKSRNLDLKLGLTKKFSDRVINDVELSDQRLTVGRLGLAFSKNSNYSLGLNLGYAQGLTLFDALDDEGMDPGAPKAQFAKYELSGNFSYPFNDTVRLSTNWSGQFSEDFLYSSEQISAGGQGSVRGFTSAPAAGDSGVYVKNDLLFQIAHHLGDGWISKYGRYLQPYIGIDGAWVKDNASSKEVSLIGAGAGIKINSGSLSGEFGIGVPIDRSTGSFSKSPDRYVRLVYDLYDY